MLDVAAVYNAQKDLAETEPDLDALIWTMEELVRDSYAAELVCITRAHRHWLLGKGQVLRATLQGDAPVLVSDEHCRDTALSSVQKRLQMLTHDVAGRARHKVRRPAAGLVDTVRPDVDSVYIRGPSVEPIIGCAFRAVPQPSPSLPTPSCSLAECQGAKRLGLLPTVLPRYGCWLSAYGYSSVVRSFS